MPITRKRRAETITEHSPDRLVKRQSDRVKKNNVSYTEYYEADISQKSNVKRQSNRLKNNNVLASSQKYCLSDIFYERCRPSLAQTNSQSQKVYYPQIVSWQKIPDVLKEYFVNLPQS